MIYSSSSHLNDDFDWSQHTDVRVWTAYYGEKKPKLPVSVDIWQYTKEGNLEGANTDKGHCDLNYSYMEATITVTTGSGKKAKMKVSVQ